MDLKELLVKLIQNRVSPNIYSIIGLTEPPEDDQYILTKEANEWILYYSERGKRLEEKHFEDEDEACRYFLNWLIKFPENLEK